MNLTTDLAIVPPPETGSRHHPTIRITRRSKSILVLNRAALRALGLEPGEAHRVQVMASTREVAIHPTPDSAMSHTINRNGEIAAGPLLDALQVRPGESFRMAASLFGGTLAASLPDMLTMRIGMAQRRQRKGRQRKEAA